MMREILFANIEISEFESKDGFTYLNFHFVFDGFGFGLLLVGDLSGVVILDGLPGAISGLPAVFSVGDDPPKRG